MSQGRAAMSFESFVSAFGRQLLGDDTQGVSSDIFKMNVAVRVHSARTDMSSPMQNVAEYSGYQARKDAQRQAHLALVQDQVPETRTVAKLEADLTPKIAELWRGMKEARTWATPTFS